MDADKLFLWRMMFPTENCSKGYGTEAVRCFIELARISGRYKGIFLDCNEENTVAMHLYEKLGFVPTGDINHGDVEMAIMFE